MSATEQRERLMTAVEQALRTPAASAALEPAPRRRWVRRAAGGAPGGRHGVFQRYGDLALVFSLAAAAVFVAGALLTHPSYRATAILSIIEPGTEDEWDLIRREVRQVNFEEQARSRAVLEPVLRSVGRLADRADADEMQRTLRSFSRHLTIVRPQQAGMLHITVSDQDPRQAAALANAVSDSLIAHRRAQAITQATSVLAAVDGELAVVGQELERLDLFTTRYGMSDIAVEELTRQLMVADQRLGELSSRYRPDNPLVAQAQRQRDAVQARLIEGTGGRRPELEHDLREAPGLLQRAGAPLRGGTVAALTTHLRARYEELLQHQAKQRLAIAIWEQPTSTGGGLLVLDEALPPLVRPASQRTKVALAGGAALALLGLVTVPFLLWIVDTRLASGPATAPAPGSDTHGNGATEQAGRRTNGEPTAAA